MKTLVLVIAFGLLATGCAHLPPSLPDNSLLITLDMDGNGSGVLISDSVRTYSDGREWDVSLQTRRLASTVARDHGLRVIDAWPLATVGEFCLVVSAPEGTLSALEQDDRIASVQALRHFVAMRAPHYNDDRVDVQLGDHAEALARLHEWSTGAGVRIGIIDSPVEKQHPDLRRRVSREVLTIDRAPVVEDMIHGTAVAGIIGAEANNHVGVVGFAPDAELFSYAACRFDAPSRQTRCNSFSMALAIEAAAEDDINVLNLSLAGPNDPLIARMLAALADTGTIIVAAENSGNEREDFPASLPFVIAAGAPSNHSPPTDVIRVNDEHLSTTVGGRYRFFYGASMSTARVTALVALMLQHAPELGMSRSRAFLENPGSDCDGMPGRNCMMRFALEGNPRSGGMMD